MRKFQWHCWSYLVQLTEYPRTSVFFLSWSIADFSFDWEWTFAAAAACNRKCCSQQDLQSSTRRFQWHCWSCLVQLTEYPRSPVFSLSWTIADTSKLALVLTENEHSQPQLHATRQIRKPLINETMNFRIPESVSSTTACLLTSILQSCISSMRRSP